MDILVEIILRYDIILIQEVVDNTGEALKTLLEKVNDQAKFLPDSLENGGVYQMEVSPRVGRNKAKEEYAVLYKAHRVKVNNKLLQCSVVLYNYFFLL